ncbi:MAG: CapA family protein [Buchananella hordeovulneris]|nr:CapA family protein [Buchananella hordeovulneris]
MQRGSNTKTVGLALTAVLLLGGAVGVAAHRLATDTDPTAAVQSSAEPTAAPSLPPVPPASLSPAAPASPAPQRPSPTPTPEALPAPPQATFSIGYAGDVLMHMPVYDSSPSGDLTQIMAPFSAWTAGVDLALCGVEVPQSPPGWEVSGYPLFGMSQAVIPSLKSAGWDGCATASNHSLDRGWEGVVTTLDALEAAGLGAAGTGRSPAEAAAPQLYRLERNGRQITVAQFSSTYGTNGIPLPAEAPWSVVHNELEALTERAKQARAQGADVVVLQIQWGNEYQTSPSEQQRAEAATLAASGQFDAIFGNHVHVPQPIEKIGNTWVAYGSGNYVSNQTPACCAPLSPVGLLPVLEVTLPAGGGPAQTKMTWTAHTTDTYGGHRVFPLADLAQGIGMENTTLTRWEVAERWEGLLAVMGGEELLRREPYTPTGPEPSVVPRPR